jgi:dihydroorotate dehydrogenase (NAD+) catalytic subunit
LNSQSSDGSRQVAAATGMGGMDRGATTNVDLSVDLCGLRLDHPVLNGSGTFDAIAARRAFGEVLLERFPFSAFVSKTITPEARIGNAAPRIFETSAGMVNSIGLPNKGLEGFVDHDLPRLAELPVPLIVSVMGRSHDEFIRLLEGVAGHPQVEAVELNVSCPNVESGLIVGEQPQETLDLLRVLRPLTSKPLIVKLTPNIADPAEVAAAVEAGGGDAVSLINTLKAAAFDSTTLRPWLGGGRGGLSGPAIRALALEQVRTVAGAVSIPVIGMGGIESGADALTFLAAGAVAIAVGTANFRDPMAGDRIRAELATAVGRVGPSTSTDISEEIRPSTST